MGVRDELTLRPTQAEDAEFLYQVYAASRQEELAPLPWDEAQKTAFLRMQFAAQHHHYHTYYPSADFWIVQRRDIPIGRLYLYRSPGEIRIMDIALLPDARRQGVGTALMTEVLTEADAAGKTVSLHVEPLNPANRLYARMGFVPMQEVGAYVLMERPPQAKV